MSEVKTFASKMMKHLTAVVVDEGNGEYSIHYQKGGQTFRTDRFPGKKLNEVSSEAQNWANGVTYLSEAS